MLTLLLVAASALLVAYLLKEAHYRRFRQNAVLPQLKPSFLWGHLKALNELRELPGQHFDDTCLGIWESLGRPPLFLLDMRPLAYRLIVVCNHEVAEQIARPFKTFPYSVTKSPTVHDQSQVTGHHSLLVMEGAEWQALRRRFNPGFAHRHLMTLLPTVFDKTFQFMRRLDSLAQTEEEFPLGELLTDLTFDIIGVVSMDVDFGAQLDKRHQSDYIQAYKALLAEFEDIDYSIPRPGRAVRRWWKTRKMDRLLTELVQDKLTEYRQLGADNKSRSIVSLASQESGALTGDMLQVVVDQVKTFMFAGHDTTSITLQWTFYELSRHPRVLEAVRAELDAVFGADPDPFVVREKFLAGGDEIMVRLSYTTAVIKEVLRLYPPAGSARMSRPGKGWKLRMPDTGREVDVDGCVLYNCHTIIQRDPAVYGETANDFVPERWLDDADVSSTTNAESDDRPGNKVPATAWRPFERGPRNCIGQDFANIEAKVILACAARRYDFTKVGLGELKLDANGRHVLNVKGAYEVKSRVYNTRQLTARPIDRMRMRVQLNPRANFDF